MGGHATRYIEFYIMAAVSPFSFISLLLTFIFYLNIFVIAFPQDTKAYRGRLQISVDDRDQPFMLELLSKSSLNMPFQPEYLARHEWYYKNKTSAISDQTNHRKRLELAGLCHPSSFLLLAFSRLTQSKRC